MTIERNLSPADWIEPLLVQRSFEEWVTAPKGYEAYASVPKVSHAMRNFYGGPLDSYSLFTNDPSYWWPDDRSWCLCTDTEFSWSY